MRLGRSNFWEGEVKNFIATNDTVKNEMLCLLGTEVSLMVKQIIYILSVEISISNLNSFAHWYIIAGYFKLFS